MAGWVIAGAALLGLLGVAGALAIGLPRLGGGKGKDASATSAAKADRHRVLLVVPERFWWPDYKGVIGVLGGQADVEVTVCSSGPGVVRPMENQGWRDAVAVPVDRVLDDVNGGDFDAVVFLGGYVIEFADKPGPRAQAGRVIREALDRGRLVAGVCGGPAVLARAGVLKGKRATVWGGRGWNLREAEVELIDEDVVEDGNLITGRDDQGKPAFANRVLERLRERKR
jgi:protease I